MRPITKLFVGTGLVAGASAYVSKNYIYRGEYHETSPFVLRELSPLQRLKTWVWTSNDDVSQTLAAKLANPGKNQLAYDYFEKELDALTTRQLLNKYKTNEEMLGAMQQALFLGPTLWPHRFVISKYFHGKTPGNNRISGYTPLEPSLKKLDLEKLPKGALDFPLLPYNPKLPYIWDKCDIVKHSSKPFDIGTVIFGMFTSADSGIRSNGGYFSFLFGSDLLPMTMVHRIEYYTKKNHIGHDILVFRLTNVSQFTEPNSPVFIDDTNGLHEFMTRTMVLDMIRGIA